MTVIEKYNLHYLIEQLREKPIKTLFLHAKGDSILPILKDVNKSFSAVDVLIYTPVITNGIDFNLSHFHYVFAYGDPRSCTERDFSQMIGRIRNPILNTYYFYFVNWHSIKLPVTLTGVQQEIERNYNYYHKHSSGNKAPEPEPMEERVKQFIDSLHFEAPTETFDQFGLEDYKSDMIRNKGFSKDQVEFFDKLDKIRALEPDITRGGKYVLHMENVWVRLALKFQVEINRSKADYKHRFLVRRSRRVNHVQYVNVTSNGEQLIKYFGNKEEVLYNIEDITFQAMKTDYPNQQYLVINWKKEHQKKERKRKSKAKNDKTEYVPIKGSKLIEDLQSIFVKYNDIKGKLSADMTKCAKEQFHEDLVAKYDVTEVVRGKELEILKSRLSIDDLNADEKIQLTKSYWFDQLKPEVQKLIDAGDKDIFNGKVIDFLESNKKILFHARVQRNLKVFEIVKQPQNIKLYCNHCSTNGMLFRDYVRNLISVLCLKIKS